MKKAMEQMQVNGPVKLKIKTNKNKSEKPRRIWMGWGKRNLEVSARDS